MEYKERSHCATIIISRDLDDIKKENQSTPQKISQVTSITSRELTYTSYTCAEKREDDISNPQGGKIGPVRIMESPRHSKGRLIPSKKISLCEIVRAGEVSQ